MDVSKIKNLGFRKDFSNVAEFERDGYRYRKELETEHFIVWRVDRDVQTWNAKWDKFEIWKKAYIKNPDGSKVLRKLSDEDGGKFYWFCHNKEDLIGFVKNHNEKFSELVPVV